MVIVAKCEVIFDEFSKKYSSYTLTFTKYLHKLIKKIVDTNTNQATFRKIKHLPTHKYANIHTRK